MLNFGISMSHRTNMFTEFLL
jgi:hypothetical protein